MSYVGQGMIAGTRVGLSMLLGCIIGWAILGPIAIGKDWVKPNSETDDWQNSEEGWVLWVSLSIMLGESLTSLFIILIKSTLPYICRRNDNIINAVSPKEQHAEMSTMRNDDLQAALLFTHNDNKSDIDNKSNINAVKQDDNDKNVNLSVDDEQDQIPNKIWMGGLFASCILCVFSLSLITKLQLVWYEALIALLFALIISILSIRALGETDMNPVSGVGKVSQIFFSLISPGNVVGMNYFYYYCLHQIYLIFCFCLSGNLVAGAMSESSAAQSGDMLQSFKTGYLLSASAKAQFYGVLIGTFASIFFSVFAYYLFISVYPDMPNSEFEVPAAELWLNMAQLLNGGSLAKNVKMFCIVAAIIGSLLSLFHDLIFIGKYEYLNKYLPSGIALAIGFYITPNYVLPRVVGAVFQFVWFRRNQDSFDKYMIVVASGFVLGEGICALLSALMTALNVPHLPE